MRYLVIGGYAVIQYSEPRYTKDLDIWIEASSSNAKRVLKALAGFGAPIDNLTEVLIKLKSAAKRPQDMADLEKLRMK